MRHLIQALVENKFGVLARIASLFSARGFNINSLAVGETQDPTVSCMTFVVNAEDERVLEQIKKQLNKLIDVITVLDLTGKEYIDRELLLLKVVKKEDTHVWLQDLAQRYPLEILEEKEEFLIVEFCVDHHTLERVLKEIKNLEIKELVRTGKIAICK